MRHAVAGWSERHRGPEPLLVGETPLVGNRFVELAQQADDAAENVLGDPACRFALEAIRRGLDMPLAEGLVLEATLFGLCAATEDMKEGMNAFLEKRPARFRGR